MVSRSSGLVPALTEFLHDFSAQSGIRADLEVDEGAAIHLPPASEVQVIRIVQEALTNVRKHAQAGRAWVRLQRQDDVVRVIIEDDGRGWEPKAVLAADPTHVGLEIMRERAENLRGTLEIATTPGRGTCVTATVPLERPT
jgi:two-component system nitrate/nitrite sensor histidine kinase NarX